MNDMKDYGFDSFFEKEAVLCEKERIARVISQSKNIYRIVCEKGFFNCEITGKMRYNAVKNSDFPAVGDFVITKETEQGAISIARLLQRKNAFMRRAAGTGENDQVVAANVDIVFIVMALNNDFNVRRLERYLSATYAAPSTPVVVLTKADLAENTTDKVCEVYENAPGVDVVVTSSFTDEGLRELLPYIQRGKTYAFMGSSGVGKSTLINRLLGNERIKTNATREDDKGRHTTTRRELLLLSNGGIVIDTPGMRELGLENADFSSSFSDIEELAALCRFSDCRHESEPGCKVKEAVENGTLSKERLQSYKKLKKEAKYATLDANAIEKAKIKEMYGSFGGIKNAKKYIKEKTKK